MSNCGPTESLNTFFNVLIFCFFVFFIQQSFSTYFTNLSLNLSLIFLVRCPLFYLSNQPLVFCFVTKENAVKKKNNNNNDLINSLHIVWLWFCIPERRISENISIILDYFTFWGFSLLQGSVYSKWVCLISCMHLTFDELYWLLQTTLLIGLKFDL